MEQGLWSWEEGFYSKHLKPGARILVVGCGTGRDLVALAKRGHRVEGVDLSAECAQAAREALTRCGLEGRVHAGDIGEIEIEGRFDVILFSYFTYKFLPQSAWRSRVLAHVGRFLSPGGQIWLTLNAPLPTEGGRGIAVTRWVARWSGADWVPEAGDALSWASGTLLYTHEFQPGEVEREASVAGFRVVYHETGEAEFFVLEPPRQGRGE